MKDLKKRIAKWLVDPTKYAVNPTLPISGRLPQDTASVALRLQSLACRRKNERSTDEIVVLCFWLLERDGEPSIEGVIHLKNNFNQQGDTYPINLSIPMLTEEHDGTFCVMVYEEDIPALFEAHDPIGLVTFHSSGAVSVYKCDYRDMQEPLVRPFQFESKVEIELDASDDGCYLLDYVIHRSKDK